PDRTLRHRPRQPGRTPRRCPMSEARGFEAFGAQRRSTRGRSWWARAWVQALEDTSLDSDQLRKGRRYANSGQVGAITISPGRIAALVYSADDTYEAVVQ